MARQTKLFFLILSLIPTLVVAQSCPPDGQSGIQLETYEPYPDRNHPWCLRDPPNPPTSTTCISPLTRPNHRGAETLNINPNTPEGKKVIEELDPGIGIAAEGTRDALGKLLSSFPKECRNNMKIIIKVWPQPCITKVEFGTKDIRRIGDMRIYGCIKENLGDEDFGAPIDECIDQANLRTGSLWNFAFTFTHLKNLVESCSKELQRRIDNGKSLAKWQDINNPNLGKDPNKGGEGHLKP